MQWDSARFRDGNEVESCDGAFLKYRLLHAMFFQMNRWQIYVETSTYTRINITNPCHVL